MSGFWTALGIYGISVALAAVVGFVGWILNYVDGSMRSARSCLTFIPWSPIWPFVMTRAVVRAMGETLGRNWL